MNNSPPGNKTSGLKTARHLPPGLGVGKVPGGAGGEEPAELELGMELGMLRLPVCSVSWSSASRGFLLTEQELSAPAFPCSFPSGERDVPCSARQSLRSRAAPAGSCPARVSRCPGVPGPGQGLGSPQCLPNPSQKGLGCPRSPSRPLPTLAVPRGGHSPCPPARARPDVTAPPCPHPRRDGARSSPVPRPLPRRSPPGPG